MELPAEGDSRPNRRRIHRRRIERFRNDECREEILLKAYAAGGILEIVSELDRTGLRISAPTWSLPTLVDSLPALFKDVPKKGDEGSEPSSPDFRARV